MLVDICCVLAGFQKKIKNPGKVMYDVCVGGGE